MLRSQARARSPRSPSDLRRSGRVRRAFAPGISDTQSADGAPHGCVRPTREPQARGTSEGPATIFLASSQGFRTDQEACCSAAKPERGARGAPATCGVPAGCAGPSHRESAIRKVRTAPRTAACDRPASPRRSEHPRDQQQSSWPVRKGSELTRKLVAPQPSPSAEPEEPQRLAAFRPGAQGLRTGNQRYAKCGRRPARLRATDPRAPGDRNIRGTSNNLPGQFARVPN